MLADAMRSMFLGMSSAGRILHVSAKDMFTSSQLLQNATDSLQKNDEEKAKEEEDGVAVNLWELTLKLRVQASDAQELLYYQGLRKLSFFLTAARYGGWPVVLKKAPNEHFMAAMHYVMLATSALHECCRYRSCCEAVYQGGMIDLLCELPLDQIQKKYKRVCQAEEDHGPMPGMLEQALIDTLGRCVNGLGQNAEHLSGIKDRLRAPCALLDGVKAGEGYIKQFVRTYGELRSPRTLMDQCHRLIDTRFLNLGKSHAQLLLILGGDSAPPWKSTFCMERHNILENGMFSDMTMVANKRCHVCMRQGPDFMYCSRCMTTVYCSKECQKAHWKVHKKECVEQKRSTAPGSMAHTLGSSAKKSSGTKF